MAKDRLYGTAPFIPLSNRSRQLLHLSIADNMNLRISPVIVPAIALINVNLLGGSPCNSIDCLHGLLKRMPIIGVAVKGLDTNDPIPLAGRSHADFHAKLIALMGLTL